MRALISRLDPRFVASRCLFVALAAGGCRRSLDVDLDRAGALVDRNAEQALRQPPVQVAMDMLLDRALADPAVSAAGQRLGAAIVADPAITGALAATVALAHGQPAVRRLVHRVMREHPDAGADRLGALAQAEVDDVTGVALGATVEKQAEEILGDPVIRAADRGLREAGRTDPGLRAFFDGYTQAAMAIAAQGRTAAGERLERLNGGAWPDRRRAADLLAARVLSQDRLASYLVALASQPGVARALATAIAKLCDSPAFQRLATRAARSFVADPEFREQAVASLAGVIDAVDPPSLEAAVRPLVQMPALAAALTDLLGRTLADTELAPIGRELLASVEADAGARAALEKLLREGW